MVALSPSVAETGHRAIGIDRYRGRPLSQGSESLRQGRTLGRLRVAAKRDEHDVLYQIPVSSTHSDALAGKVFIDQHLIRRCSISKSRDDVFVLI